jgi:hypothetical protein
MDVLADPASRRLLVWQHFIGVALLFGLPALAYIAARLMQPKRRLNSTRILRPYPEARAWGLATKDLRRLSRSSVASVQTSSAPSPSGLPSPTEADYDANTRRYVEAYLDAYERGRYGPRRPLNPDRRPWLGTIVSPEIGKG